jgi:hypothetical protein
MTFADLEVVTVPCDRALDDLTVYSCIAAKLILTGPLFKIEEVAEELEGVGLAE